MNKELIINTEDDNIRLALLEEGRLMELHLDMAEQEFAVGDIYLGNVKKIMPGLNAAFIDIGYEKSAFLHYHDLGKQVKSSLKYTLLTRSSKQASSKLDTFTLEKDIEKDDKISNILDTGQKVLVQITKEPISTKGPRITAEISIAGRYLVLVPFMDKISISQKIKDKEERERLIRLMSSIRPKGFGIIIRTVAKNKKVAELHTDLNLLINKWNHCYNNLKNKTKSPTRILSEIDKASSIMRDIFDDSFSQIVCDNAELAQEIEEYVTLVNPDKKKIVKHYEENSPIFERYGIERQIKVAFGRTVSMPKGAYLVIDHTEALHVIDVNSGNSTSKNNSQEENALNVNKIAATEIARQLRLRDMGGIIVIDFIDLTTAENRHELYEHFKTEMQKDRAKHKILPPSKFGLIQMTRQRVRPTINIETTDSHLENIKSSAELLEALELHLQAIFNHPNSPKIIYLHVHPFVKSYLTKGVFSKIIKWQLQYKKRIKIISREAFGVLEYAYYDVQKNKI